jgi:hypothetical protein
MATLAPSAAPINALRMWTDGREIYVEIPGSAAIGTPPYITSYPLHEGGLWRALNMLRTQSYEYAGPSMMVVPKPDKAADLVLASLRKNGAL